MEEERRASSKVGTWRRLSVSSEPLVRTIKAVKVKVTGDDPETNPAERD